MQKDNLVQAIVKKVGVSSRQATESLTVVLDEIAKSLSRGEEVSLTGFGKFKVVEKKAREGRNPKTGEKISIEARKSPVFKAGSALKETVK